jgi:hypothetical protein
MRMSTRHIPALLIAVAFCAALPAFAAGDASKLERRIVTRARCGSTRTPRGEAR